jgi:hypothetical protein
MKWEYLTAKLVEHSNNGISLTTELNYMGEKEWELVGFDLAQNCFIFKRPKALSNSDMERIRKLIESAIKEYFD